MSWGDGGEANTAVAHDDGGDAMPGRRRQMVVPRGLAVVVGVNVDKTGCHQRTGCVDLAPATALDLADLDDGLAIDCDVGGSRRGPTAVDDCSASNYELMHMDHFPSWSDPSAAV